MLFRMLLLLLLLLLFLPSRVLLFLLSLLLSLLLPSLLLLLLLLQLPLWLERFRGRRRLVRSLGPGVLLLALLMRGVEFGAMGLLRMALLLGLAQGRALPGKGMSASGSTGLRPKTRGPTPRRHARA